MDASAVAMDTPAEGQLRRAVIIHNPISGRPQGHQVVGGVAARLRRLGWQVEVAMTQQRGDGTRLAAQAVREGFPLVVAAGGDGTVNEVMQPLVGTRTALGVLPVGTVNLWAAETMTPADPEALATLLARCRTRWVDVGRIGDRYFLLMVSLGFDAAVVSVVNLELKRRFGRLSYALVAGNLAPTYRGTPITLRLDGRERRMTVLVLLVGNTRRYGGRWQPIPQAIADDGLFDVLAVRGERVWSGLPQMGALLGGGRWRRGLFQARAAEIEVESEVVVPVQMDGDAAGGTPVRITALARALRVVVGENRHGLFGAPDE